ncbi:MULTISPECIES: zinc-ribbon domain-containing protein [unclassified Marinovum]
MRLTCPNCDAQYEVPDDVIPPDGRDVQCSSCGKTWFQAAPNEDAMDDADPVRQSARPDPVPESAPDPAPAPAPVPPPEPAPAPPPRPEPAPDMPEAQPRKLDPEVASVLREEAERETRVRQAERGAVESQPDLGLDDMSSTDHDAEIRARQSRERMARMRGQDPEKAAAQTSAATAAAAAAASGSRRELLPDIEEINSTLRSTDQPRQQHASEESAAEPERATRSGFRRGFTYILLLAAVAALLYIYAPQIAERVPALASTLEAYVIWVGEMRIWLDARILAGLQWLDGMASEASPQ